MSSCILCRWKQFAVVQGPHALPDGRVVEHTRVDHPGAVLILPLTEQGELVLVRQYRPSVARWLLELPAGTLEPGEAIPDCAARELAEEVQLQAAQWQPLGELLPAPGFCNEILHTFVARQLSPATGELDEDEVIEVVRMPLAAFERAVADGEVVDAKTLALYARARARGIL